MSNYLRIIFLGLTIVFLSIAGLSAQKSVGFNIGLSAYEGDLHCFEDPQLGLANSAGLSLGLHYKRSLSKLFAARLAYQFASFSGNDNDFVVASGHPSRGFEFSNFLHEATVRLDLEPWQAKKFSPFVSVGLGFAINNPNTTYNMAVQSDAVQALIAEDEDNLARLFVAVPIGLGFNVNLNEKFSIGTEFGMRLPVTDYLDGVALSAPTSNYNDYFGTGVLTLSYVLGNTISKPKVNKMLDGPSDQAVISQPPSDNGGGSAGDLEAAKAKRQAMDEEAKANTEMMKMMAEERKALELVRAEALAAEKAAEEARQAAEKAEMAAKAAQDAVSGTMDSDKDGIIDRLDACPSIFAATASGCPENTTTSDVNCSANFGSKTIRFKTSFAALSGEDKAALNEVIDIMMACPTKKVVIEGHTDSDGSELVNQDLSNSRSKAVKKYISSRGVSANRILAVGYGETRPVADNSSSEGKAQNRRVEISFY